MIVLDSDRLRLHIDPDRGVQWSALEARRGDDWLALVPDCREDSVRPRVGQDESAPLPAASFHMIPYSNRVRDGRFEFGGTAHALPAPERHAIHGIVRKRPWRVVSHEAGRAECAFDSAEHPDAGWPWPIRCTIVHELDGSELRATMSVTNAGDSPMPAGLGWHPYFVREIDGASPTLELPVDAVFPDAGATRMPDGPAIPLPDALDFRTARALDPAQHIDCCLAGLDGPIRIRWPDAELGLTMHPDAACRYLVLFNPGMPHFAVEPVTNANDAFNLASRGIESGVRTLVARRDARGDAAGGAGLIRGRPRRGRGAGFARRRQGSRRNRPSVTPSGPRGTWTVTDRPSRSATSVTGSPRVPVRVASCRSPGRNTRPSA